MKLKSHRTEACVKHVLKCIFILCLIASVFRTLASLQRSTVLAKKKLLAAQSVADNPAMHNILNRLDEMADSISSMSIYV